jgi:hypothetical protein
MEKDETTERDDTQAKGLGRRGEDKSSQADSANELEPVTSTKNEPADNLRRRAEWFQKRSGRG